MSDRSQFSLDLDAIQIAPTPYGQSVGARRSLRKTLLPGDGTDQLRVVFAYEAVLAASGTYGLDLKTATDRFGAAIAADDLCVLFVENVVDPGGGGALEIRPGSSNGFTNLLGASSAVKLPIGSFLTIGNFTADKYVVTSSNKALDFVETSGSLPVLLRIQLWARRA